MLHKVLLLGSKSQTIVGRPHVPKAAVFAVVEEHVRKKLRKTIHKVAVSISLELASIDYSILSFILLNLSYVFLFVGDLWKYGDKDSQVQHCFLILEFEPLYRKEFLAVGSPKYNFGGVQQLSNMSFLLWVLTNHGLPNLAWFLHLDTLGIDVPPPKFRNGDDQYSTEDSGTYLKWLFDFMQALDEKVIIFKKKRRKNYRRTTGHRQVSLSLI